MFSCKACKAHQAHIDSLLAQVADLRRLTIPNADRKEIAYPHVELEADAVISGHSEQIIVDEADPTPQEEIDREADRLLSGTY